MLIDHRQFATMDDHKTGATDATASASTASTVQEELSISDPSCAASNSGTFPDGGRRAWLVVFGSFCLLLCTFGLQTSVGLIQEYWKLHQLSDFSISQIAWIPSVFVFLSLALGTQVGAVFDRYGPRGILGGGSLAYVVCMFAIAHAETYWQFMLCFVLGGIGAAAITTAALGVISHWFRERKGSAMGIALSGSGLGGIMFPLVLRSTFATYGWTWSMQILGFVVLFLVILGNLCIRGRLPPGTARSQIDLTCFLDARFTLLCASTFGKFGDTSLLVSASLGAGLQHTWAAMMVLGQQR